MTRTRLQSSGIALLLTAIALTIPLGAAVTLPLDLEPEQHASPAEARSSRLVDDPCGGCSSTLAIVIRLHVDPSIKSERITGHVKDETEAIWRPYGIRLNWADVHALEPAAGIVSFDAHLERRFEGRQGPEVAAVLGRVALKHDQPNGQPIRVSFDATEGVLALRMTSRSVMSGIVLDRELAGALGRVLAHEIGHVLLGADHDRTGLMRAVFPADELAEPDRAPFRLTCSGVDRLRNRWRALSSSLRLVSQDDSPGGAACIAIQSAR